MAHHQKKRLPYRNRDTHVIQQSLFARLPRRAADKPFCAYFGPHGEICVETTKLEEVLSISGPPHLTWMACPTHREEVRQLAQALIKRATSASQTVAFTYQGTTYETQVRTTDKLQA